MDTSPSAQAAPRDGSGKPVPDPADMAGNQASGDCMKGVPSDLVWAQAVPGRVEEPPPSEQPSSRSVGPLVQPHAPYWWLHDMQDEDFTTARSNVVATIPRATVMTQPASISSSCVDEHEGKETYVRVKLGPVLRATNAKVMFKDGVFHSIRNGHAYFKYPNMRAAQVAHLRVNKGNSFQIKVGVNVDWDTPDREKSSAHHAAKMGRTKRCDAVDVDWDTSELHPYQAAAQEMKRAPSSMRITMNPSPFGWRFIIEFCSITGNECALLFKFGVAAKFGSICSSVNMTSTTDIGNTLFPGLIGYMFQAFEAKKSWGGNICLDNYVVAKNGMCAIVPYPSEDATDSNIKQDLTALVDSLAELYSVDGILPPYFEEIFSILNDIPAGAADDPAVLKEIMLQLVNSTCFMPDCKQMGLLQEFYVFFKNLDDPTKEEFNEDTAELCNSSWQDMPEIDSLLNAVLKATKALKPTVADEATYLRHVGTHITDQVYNIWIQVKKMMETLDATVTSKLEGKPEPLPRFVLKERLMFIAYYFGDFLPKLFRFLLRAMSSCSWIRELCSPFLRQKFDIAAAPFGSVDLAKDELAG